MRNVDEHAHDIVNADMSYPIIVVRGGEIIDGAHRVARAYIEGRESIEAVVIDNTLNLMEYWPKVKLRHRHPRAGEARR